MKSWHKNSYRMLVIPLANTVWAMIVPWPFAPSVKFDRIPKQWNWQSSRFRGPANRACLEDATSGTCHGHPRKCGSEWIGMDWVESVCVQLRLFWIRFTSSSGRSCDISHFHFFNENGLNLGLGDFWRMRQAFTPAHCRSTYVNLIYWWCHNPKLARCLSVFLRGVRGQWVLTQTVRFFARLRGRPRASCWNRYLVDPCSLT